MSLCSIVGHKKREEKSISYFNLGRFIHKQIINLGISKISRILIKIEVVFSWKYFSLDISLGSSSKLKISSQSDQKIWSLHTATEKQLNVNCFSKISN